MKCMENAWRMHGESCERILTQIRRLHETKFKHKKCTVVQPKWLQKLSSSCCGGTQQGPCLSQRKTSTAPVPELPTTVPATSFTTTTATTATTKEQEQEQRVSRTKINQEEQQ